MARLWVGLFAREDLGPRIMLKVDPPVAKTTVSFVLNGSRVYVKDASPLLSLNDWLRAQGHCTSSVCVKKEAVVAGCWCAKC